MTYTSEERAANRAKWAAALRSGEYKQGTSALVSVNEKDGSRSYCCLGVACELAVKEGVIPAWGSATDREGNPVPGYPFKSEFAAWENAVLPMAVADWLGVTQRGKTTRTYRDKWEESGDDREPTGVEIEGDEDFPANLIYFNDEVHAPFTEIADIIESGDLLVDLDDLSDDG